MENALSTISLLPENNSQVKAFANLLIKEVECGNVNSLKLKTQLKFIEKSLELVEKGIKDSYLKEAAKYSKEFEFNGFLISQSENIAPKYDYTVCNDPLWNDLDLMIKKLSEQKKDRETFLKSISGHVEVVNETTGEMVAVNPPIKSSTTGLIMKAL